jgi:hypothetical protein
VNRKNLSGWAVTLIDIKTGGLRSAQPIGFFGFFRDLCALCSERFFLF